MGKLALYLRQASVILAPQKRLFPESLKLRYKVDFSKANERMKLIHVRIHKVELG